MGAVGRGASHCWVGVLARPLSGWGWGVGGGVLTRLGMGVGSGVGVGAS